MKYRYREPHEMKDSGVEWLGMIPKEWKVSKLKYHFNIKSGATPKSEIKEYWDGNLDWYTPVDLGETKFLNNSKRKITEAGLKSCSANIIKAGSIIMSSRAPIGSVSIAVNDFTTNQGCKSLEFKGNMINNFIYYYILISKRNLENLGSGTTFLEISGTTFSNYQVPYLKIQEQQKIADFLDKKCEEFDSVIAKKEILINKLGEAKKSLISEVVTGKVKVIEKENGEYRIIKREAHEMKDSGVEWLGMIPKEWGTSKIKYNTYVKGRIGWQGLKSDEFIEVGAHLVTGTDFKNNSINWETCYRISEERYKEAPAIHLRNGDLLITKDGTIGKLAIVENCPEQAVLNSGVFVTRCLNLDYLTKFMFYILDSKMFSTYIDINKTGSTIVHLYQETFVKFSYPLPNLNIQKNIIKYLDEKCSQFDLTIGKQKESIEKLKSAKQSLISEAVTGKIEIL